MLKVLTSQYSISRSITITLERKKLNEDQSAYTSVTNALKQKHDKIYLASINIKFHYEVGLWLKIKKKETEKGENWKKIKPDKGMINKFMVSIHLRSTQLPLMI